MTSKKDQEKEWGLMKCERCGGFMPHVYKKTDMHNKEVPLSLKGSYRTYRTKAQIKYVHEDFKHCSAHWDQEWYSVKQMIRKPQKYYPFRTEGFEC